jgi:cell division protein FtsB
VTTNRPQVRSYTVSRSPVFRPVTIVVAVLVVLTVLITPYFRSWLAQRGALSTKEQQVSDLQQEVEAMQEEKERWDDPEYVRAQARDRLNYVMPGDTGYVLITPEEEHLRQDPRDAAAAVAGSASDLAWYEALWQSVTIAGTTPEDPSDGATGDGR